MKKYIVIFSLCLTAVLAPSCDKFLEEDLTHLVSSESYYTTAAGLNDAVNACYFYTKEYWSPAEMGATLNCFGIDAYTNGADGSHKGINFYDAQLGPDESYFRDSWAVLYQAVNQCNAVVGRSTEIEDLDATTRDLRVAEVRYLRALFYFQLVKMYGDVHFSLDETIGVETEANRTPREQIYAEAIIPDLEFAIATLPATQSNYGRATKPAAEFLLAKVLATRGWLTNSNADFARAETLMESVINNYSFALLENWGDLWDMGNQLNSEVVWAIQNTTDPILNGGQGNRMHLYFLMEYDVLPGMTRDVENGRPWKRFRPTTWLETLFNDTPGSAPVPLGTRRDVRYQQGFKHVFLANNPGTAPAGVGRGDTAVFLPGYEVSQAFRDSKPYMIITPSEYSDRRFPSLNKFIDPTRPDRQWVQGQRDFALMRLADAYLIAAEAEHKQGKNEEAAAHINVVRRRAGREGQKDQMEITAADVTVDYILDERTRELLGEMHGWDDLVRMGKLVERVRLHNVQAAGNIQDFHTLRPIPRTQLDRATNGYSQNPGYVQ
jgi:starch-binding outer membrane protein, SusD/RagB family